MWGDHLLCLEGRGPRVGRGPRGEKVRQGSDTLGTSGTSPLQASPPPFVHPGPLSPVSSCVSMSPILCVDLESGRTQIQILSLPLRNHLTLS